MYNLGKKYNRIVYGIISDYNKYFKFPILEHASPPQMGRSEH